MYSDDSHDDDSHPLVRPSVEEGSATRSSPLSSVPEHGAMMREHDEAEWMNAELARQPLPIADALLNLDRAEEPFERATHACGGAGNRHSDYLGSVPLWLAG